MINPKISTIIEYFFDLILKRLIKAFINIPLSDDNIVHAILSTGIHSLVLKNNCYPMQPKIANNLLFTWKTLLTSIICFFVLFITGCSSKGTKDDLSTFVFKNITVIDAVNGVRTGQSVVVRGERIIETGFVEEIRQPFGATIIECSGKYLIPGLWDAHVHLTNSKALIPVIFPLLIVNGITYVRDTGAELNSILPLREEAKEFSQSKGMAPDIFITGPHLDGLQLSWNSSVSAVSVEQARFIIDCLINRGVNEIKVYDLLSPDVFFEVLSIAKRKGYNVSAHVPLGMDVIEASNAGLSSMEHMINLEMSCSSDWDSLLKERRKMIAEGTEKSGRELRGDIYRSQRLHAFKTQDEERRDTVLKILAVNRTWQVPTLTLIAQAEHKIYSRNDWRKTFRYLPEPVRSEWENNAIRKSGQSPSEANMAHASWAYDMIPRLDKAGIGIMAGTDMPLALLTPGFSLHEELALLVRAGLTPMQAIESATLHPAQYFGLEKQQGSIAKNMKADLVLLDANPLENITNTRRIRAVMRNGYLHTRDDLDDILTQLEKNENLLNE